MAELTRKQIERAVADLFTNGSKQRATRLVLVREDPGKMARIVGADDLGGMVESATVDWLCEMLLPKGEGDA